MNVAAPQRTADCTGTPTLGVAAVAMLLVLLLALGACTAGDQTSPPSPAASPSPSPTPSDGALPVFYRAPAALPDEPGQVIRAERISAPDGALAWRTLSTSTDIHGDIVAVSGMVIRPDRAAPPGGFPVLSWAHATTGVADVCAPSRAGLASIPLLSDLLDAGFVITATDYQGLGTHGIHPYLVGDAAGRNVLDAARAAQRMSVADAGSPVIALGNSQGGHAVLFAAELASSYAPELDLAGVVAGGPVYGADQLIETVVRQPQTMGFLALAFTPWAQVYDDLALSAVLSPAAREQTEVVDKVCATALVARFAVLDAAEIALVADPRELPGWSAALERNDVGGRAPSVPVLLVQGREDQLIAPAATRALRDTLCGFSPRVDLVEVAASHDGALNAAAEDVLAWIGARKTGAAPTEPLGGCA